MWMSILSSKSVLKTAIDHWIFVKCEIIHRVSVEMSYIAFFLSFSFFLLDYVESTINQWNENRSVANRLHCL